MIFIIAYLVISFVLFIGQVVWIHHKDRYIEPNDVRIAIPLSLLWLPGLLLALYFTVDEIIRRKTR